MDQELQTIKPKPNIFTSRELLLSIVITVVVVAVGYFALNPLASINQINSDQIKAEVEVLAAGLDNYASQSEQPIPTYENGKPLPTVTTDTLFEEGVDVTLIDNFEGEYITKFPENSTGTDYRIGVLSGGTIIIGAMLPNTEIFSKLIE